MIRRIAVFLLTVPDSIRLGGGVFNPWLWHSVRACWLRTGPPPPPIQMSDEEWDAWVEGLDATSRR